MNQRDKDYVKELFNDLKAALATHPDSKGVNVDLDAFIDDADRDLIDSAVAYAWGRLLGAAEILDVTVLELLNEAGVP